MIAAVLPWLEILCGCLLIAGIAVRGSSLVTLCLLILFTALVWQRALAIHQAKSIALCAVRFDCGCGAGEVLACRKLVENSVLILFSALLLLVRADRWTLRYELVKGSLKS